MELRGKTGDGKYATYKMYLGKDNFVNYDVQRNYFYKVDLTLNGVSAFDGRINSGKLMPTSNCYMLLPGQTIVIPATARIAEGWTTIKGTSTNYLVNGEKWTANLLWTDNANGVGAAGSVASIKADPAGGYIWVTAGSAPGNSVIAAKRADGTVAWSWHIWVTDYNVSVSPAQKGTTYNSNNLTFMDRNLGATTSTSATVTTLGLLYQWGRKDPFPGANAVTTGTTTPLQIYAADKTPLTQGTSGTGIKYLVGTSTLTNAANNPATFLAPNGGNNNDWCSPQNSTLWGSPTGLALPNVKSVYDPCPPGWRVAYRSEPLGIITPWYDLSTSKGLYNLGWDFTSYGASYYPATGYRSASDGTLNGVGNQLNMFCATASGSTNAYSFYFVYSPSAFDNYHADSRGHGFPVRCVKE